MYRLIALTVIMLSAASAVSAQQPALIAGGLTALPVSEYVATVAENGGFDTLDSGAPAEWTGGPAWAADQLVKRSGTASMRLDGSRTTATFYGATQTLVLKRGTYRLSAWIKTHNFGTNSTRSGLRLTLDFRPQINEWVPSTVARGTFDWRYFEVKAVVPEDRIATIKLEGYYAPTGTAWIDDLKLEPQLAPGVEFFMLYPNYRGMLFGDQPQAMRFDLTVTPPRDDYAAFMVRGTLVDEATGRVVQTRTSAASPHFIATLDGSVMQPGKAYLAKFALVDRATGRPVRDTYPPYRVSKVPAAARASMKIAFDHKNRVLVHGVPRFLLGVYDSGLDYSTRDAYWEEWLWSPTSAYRRMEGMPINLYLNYHYGNAPVAPMHALMTSLQTRGVSYLQTANCFERTPASAHTPPFLVDASDAYVDELDAHPGLAGYYTNDECHASTLPSVFAQYQRLKRLDPDSITFAALRNHLNDAHVWRDSVDVIATDPYPIYGPEGTGYPHEQVWQWARQTREAVKDARPFGIVLQFFRFSVSGSRRPTFQEMRNHAYTAIAEGARGLMWWSLGVGGGLQDVCAGWCADKTGRMNQLKTLVSEIADLEPVLLSADSGSALSANSAASTIRTKVKVLNGVGYVFAYNSTARSVSATLTWHRTPLAVLAYREDRTLPVAGRSFTDTFAPHQARVYVVDTTGNVPPWASAAAVLSVAEEDGEPE